MPGLAFSFEPIYFVCVRENAGNVVWTAIIFSNMIMETRWEGFDSELQTVAINAVTMGFSCMKTAPKRSLNGGVSMKSLHIKVIAMRASGKITLRKATLVSKMTFCALCWNTTFFITTRTRRGKHKIYNFFKWREKHVFRHTHRFWDFSQQWAGFRHHYLAQCHKSLDSYYLYCAHVQCVI